MYLNLQIRDQINNKMADRHSVERQTADVFELKDTRFKHRKRQTLSSKLTSVTYNLQ